MPTQTFSILFLEKNSSQVEAVENILLNANFSFTLRVVESEEALFESIALVQPDLVLLNSSLLTPFKQIEVLQFLKKIKTELPIFFLAHPSAEENLLELFCLGLEDYLLFDELKRLPFKLKRILNEREKNKEKIILQNTFLKRTEELVNHQRAILSLAKMPFVHLKEMLENLTKTDAQVLKVERVGVWLFNQDRTELFCECLYQFGQNSFESGLSLNVEDFPRYFQAISPTRVISVSDAREDPRTSDFLEPYLKSYDIFSMMDVPIRLHGEMIGVLCHEHVGEKREWSIEDEQFASSIADMVSLALESSERQKIQLQLSQTTQELKRSNEELERFAYIASHDLQEPLLILRAYIEDIRAEDPEILQKPEIKYALDRMAHTSSRMTRLVSDLLQFARVHVKPRPFKEIDLGKLIKELKEDFEAQISASMAQIDIPQILPALFGDESQIRQLFKNLFSNAFKFRDPLRPLKIKITAQLLENNEIEIKFQDNGIGFSSEFEEQIFEPFFRLHSKHDYEGSGIGLSLCQRIVERHKGFISSKSKVGEGTQFVIRFSSFTS